MLRRSYFTLKAFITHSLSLQLLQTSVLSIHPLLTSLHMPTSWIYNIKSTRKSVLSLLGNYEMKCTECEHVIYYAFANFLLWTKTCNVNLRTWIRRLHLRWLSERANLLTIIELQSEFVYTASKIFMTHSVYLQTFINIWGR